MTDLENFYPGHLKNEKEYLREKAQDIAKPRSQVIFIKAMKE